MNKYAISRLNPKMEFNDELFRQKLKELLIDSKLIRLDDFEFELELNSKKYSNSNSCKKLLNILMQICSMVFWVDKSFKITEPQQIILKEKIVTWQPLKVDAFIIKSSENKIHIELFLYQQRALLFSSIFTAKFEA